MEGLLPSLFPPDHIEALVCQTTLIGNPLQGVEQFLDLCLRIICCYAPVGVQQIVGVRIGKIGRFPCPLSTVVHCLNLLGPVGKDMHWHACRPHPISFSSCSCTCGLFHKWVCFATMQRLVARTMLGMSGESVESVHAIRVAARAHKAI